MRVAAAMQLFLLMKQHSVYCTGRFLQDKCYLKFPDRLFFRRFKFVRKGQDMEAQKQVGRRPIIGERDGGQLFDPSEAVGEGIPVDMQRFADGCDAVMLHDVAPERLEVACAICTILRAELVDCGMDAVGGLDPHSRAHQEGIEGDVVKEER